MKIQNDKQQIKEEIRRISGKSVEIASTAAAHLWSICLLMVLLRDYCVLINEELRLEVDRNILAWL